MSVRRFSPPSAQETAEKISTRIRCLIDYNALWKHC
jgi:hypothetical protein